MKIEKILIIALILFAALSITAVSAENVDNDTAILASDNINVDSNDVSDVNGTIVTNDLEKYYGNSEPFIASFFDANGSILTNEKVSFNINGKDYYRTTDNDGIASIKINLDYGNYVITTTNLKTGESVQNNISIYTTILGNDLVKYYKNNEQYEAIFLDTNGKTLSNTQVEFNINGVFYKKTTDNNGVAKLNINLNPNKYIITATNPITNQIYSNNIVVKSTINGSDITKYYKNGTQYYVCILDGQGNPVASKDITMNINGVYYTRTTDANGWAKLTINLNPDKYVLTVYNPVTTELSSNNITVLSRIIAKDIEVEYQGGGKYTAQVVDEQGKPMANQNVNLNINGMIYTRVTDANGTISITINLNPGTYICTAYTNDLSYSSTITVKKVPIKLQALNNAIKSGETFDVQVTEEKTGNPVVNQMVVFIWQEEGSSYGVYTDENGVAGLRIEPVGSYQFLIGLNENDWYASTTYIMSTVTVS